MKETHVYHGHSIDLELSDAHARIRWTYFIDRHYCIQGAAEWSSIESARVSALALARRSIDVLDSMRSDGAACAQGPVPAMMDPRLASFAVGSLPGPMV